MDTLTGELSHHFYNTVILTAVVAAIVLWRYRAAVLAGMRRSDGPGLAVGPAFVQALPSQPTETPLQEVAAWERRARWCLGGAWILGVAASSLVLATSYVHLSGWQVSPAILLLMTLIFTTAAAPMIAVALAVPFWRGVAGTVVMVILCAFLSLVAGLLERALSGRPLTLTQLQLFPLYFTFAANTLWLPGLLFLATAAVRLRGVVPITFAALLVFGLAPFAGSQLTARIAASEAGSEWALRLGFNGVFVLIAVPAALLAWCRLHAMARAYEAKRFSDVQLLARSWWLMLVASVAFELLAARPQPALSFAACTVSYLVFAPINRFFLGRSGVARGRPPPRTLLLLRVFGYTARTERLFDRIGARWRLLGPVTMIAAPDVVARTIDPGDYLRYLTGRLAEHFIKSRRDLKARLAALDLRPDPDQRYRINDFCCREDTWQATVVELMNRADAVVMDLRGFTSERRGCEFELAEIGRRLAPSRVVLVVDAMTDHARVEHLLGAAAPGVRMLELGRARHGRIEPVFNALVEAAGGSARRGD